MIQLISFSFFFSYIMMQRMTDESICGNANIKEKLSHIDLKSIHCGNSTRREDASVKRPFLGQFSLQIDFQVDNSLCIQVLSIA